MLSVGRCRQILGAKVPLTDSELQQLRDELYAVARHAVRLFDARREVTAQPLGTPLIEVSFSTLLAQIPEADRYALEERAAIHEFDGNMLRASAEKETARAYVLARRNEAGCVDFL